ncbi:hypothetical protein GS429_14910 [Natronorubrum sp. JWXQ-INN-674]|uniref:Uncharacterized protein n=1 Tax=Natronorubrum halalkaliphilum TaxID=2691917 RepID=A0A6B0VRB6_9EURY|nr:hypothetical protein [Natronorubrum halalkaliphilum]MXV63332.1 hypothetical protein [Natronorubrum halalkaliphilum]
MDSKRPDVRLDDSSDEDGFVTKRNGSDDESESSDSLLEAIRSFLR